MESFSFDSFNSLKLLNSSNNELIDLNTISNNIDRKERLSFYAVVIGLIILSFFIIFLILYSVEYSKNTNFK